MSTNLEYRARERQRKREVGGRPATFNVKKGDRRNKGDIFLLEEQHENFVAAVTKWEMLTATNQMQGESERQWKKVNEKTCDISPIKSVTEKFLEVSRCSRAKQRQRNAQKKCAVRAKLLLPIRPIVVFHRFAAVRAFAA